MKFVAKNLKNIYLLTLLVCFLAVFLVSVNTLRGYMTKNVSAEGYGLDNPYADIPQGSCHLEFGTYDYLPELRIPIRGSKEQSSRYQGVPIYERFYVSCPEKNNDKRPLIVDYRFDGRLETGGNLAVKGERTFLITKYAAVKFGKEKSFVYINHEGNVEVSGDVSLNTSWYELDDSRLGPSIYMNSNSSKLDLSSTKLLVSGIPPTDMGRALVSESLPRYAQVSSFRGNDVIRVDDVNDRGTWSKLGIADNGGNGILREPTSFSYMGGYYYIADQGNKMIVRYGGEDDVTYLGGGSWGWSPEGIAVDSDEFIYITDSERGNIIKTKIDGSDWQEFYGSDDDYYTKLFITGEENLIISNLGGAIAGNVDFYDSGYSWRKVSAVSENGYFDYDPVSREIVSINEIPTLHWDGEDKLFGKKSVYLDGQSSLVVESSKGLDFESEEFAVDTWIKFDSTDQQTIVSKSGSFDLYINEAGNLDFNIVYKGTEAGQLIETVSSDWSPTADTWYHLAVVRRNDDALDGKVVEVYVDGVRIARGGANRHGVQHSENELVIGALGYEKIGYSGYFTGNLDNFRLTRGSSRWHGNFVPSYYLDNPKGIIINGDYLYVVDSGNDRIVKINKDFSSWQAFGAKGENNFEFNNPLDIAYASGNYYVIDEGNERIVRMELNNTSNRFNYGGGGFSWLGESYLTGDFYDAWNLAEEDSHNRIDDVLFNDYFNFGERNIQSCPNENGASWSIADYFQGRMYAGRKIKVMVGAGETGGSLRLRLTKNVGAGEVDNMTNEGFNQVRNVLVPDNGDGYAIFEIPHRVNFFADNTPVSLRICGDTNISRLRVSLMGEIEPRSIFANNNGVYFTDVNNNRIVEMSHSLLFTGSFGGKNVDDNSMRFAYPVDIYRAGNGMYHVLDGSGEKDLTIKLKEPRGEVCGESTGASISSRCGAPTPSPDRIRGECASDGYYDYRGIEFYGTEQEKGIGMYLEDGAVKSNNLDLSALTHDEDESVLGTDNRVWVGYQLGPAISHCPGDMDTQAQGSGYENYMNSCAKSPDAQGNCDNFRYDNDDCDVWAGLGEVADCRVDAPLSDCYGQWDWYREWPRCTYYEANINRFCSLREACRDHDNSTSTPNIAASWCDCLEYTCETSCQPDEASCFAGYALRQRPDYKHMTINFADSLESPAITESVTIKLYHDRMPTPEKMETLIKGIEEYNNLMESTTVCTKEEERDGLGELTNQRLLCHCAGEMEDYEEECSNGSNVGCQLNSDGTMDCSCRSGFANYNSADFDQKSCYFRLDGSIRVEKEYSRWQAFSIRDLFINSGYIEDDEDENFDDIITRLLDEGLVYITSAELK